MQSAFFWKLKLSFNHLIGIFYDQLYGKKCCYKHLGITIFFFQNLDFFRYFWHKSLIKVLLPKVPQKVQILENKKNFIFSEFKNTTFLFYKCWPLMVDVDQTAIFQPVDVGRRPFYSPFHHPHLWDRTKLSKSCALVKIIAVTL